jgi:hypothetical protein
MAGFWHSFHREKRNKDVMMLTFVTIVSMLFVIVVGNGDPDNGSHKDVFLVPGDPFVLVGNYCEADGLFGWDRAGRRLCSQANTSNDGFSCTWNNDGKFTLTKKVVEFNDSGEYLFFCDSTSGTKEMRKYVNVSSEVERFRADEKLHTLTLERIPGTSANGSETNYTFTSMPDVTKDSLSTWNIIFVVLGIVAFVGLLFAVTYYIIRKKYAAGDVLPYCVDRKSVEEHGNNCKSEYVASTATVWVHQPEGGELVVNGKSVSSKKLVNVSQTAIVTSASEHDQSNCSGQNGECETNVEVENCGTKQVKKGQPSQVSSAHVVLNLKSSDENGSVTEVADSSYDVNGYTPVSPAAAASGPARHEDVNSSFEYTGHETEGTSSLIYADSVESYSDSEDSDCESTPMIVDGVQKPAISSSDDRGDQPERSGDKQTSSDQHHLDSSNASAVYARYTSGRPDQRKVKTISTDVEGDGIELRALKSSLLHSSAEIQSPMIPAVSPFMWAVELVSVSDHAHNDNG